MVLNRLESCSANILLIIFDVMSMRFVFLGMLVILFATCHGSEFKSKKFEKE